MENELLIADRNGAMCAPTDVADTLDALADRSNEITGEVLHDAADVVRGLVRLVEVQKKEIVLLRRAKLEERKE